MRAPDGAGARLPLHGEGPRARNREGGANERPHPGPALRNRAALVQRRTRHRAVLRRQVGRGRLPAGGSRTGRNGFVPQIHPARRGGRRVPLPRKLPRLLLEDRRRRRAGLPRLRRRWTPGQPRTGAEPTGRRLRSLRNGGLVPDVRRAAAGRPSGGRRAGFNQYRRQGGD